MRSFGTKTATLPVVGLILTTAIVGGTSYANQWGFWDSWVDNSISVEADPNMPYFTTSVISGLDPNSPMRTFQTQSSATGTPAKTNVNPSQYREFYAEFSPGKKKTVYFNTNNFKTATRLTLKIENLIVKDASGTVVTSGPEYDLAVEKTYINITGHLDGSMFNTAYLSCTVKDCVTQDPIEPTVFSFTNGSTPFNLDPGESYVWRVETSVAPADEFPMYLPGWSIGVGMRFEATHPY